MTKFNIQQMDCVQGMTQMAPDSVDVVVTSPPYNLGVKYRSYKDDLPIPEYLKWAFTWLSAIDYVIKPEGSFFLNFAGSPTKPRLPYLLADHAMKHFELQNTFHWIKSITVQKPREELVSVGHFKPISSDRFVNDAHEFIFHFTKSGKVKLDRLAIGVPFADKSNIKRFKKNQSDLRCRGNTWFVPYATTQTSRGNPASFPVALVENCLKIHGNVPRQTVLDPFMGEGNSALAAQNLGVAEYFGFELDALDVTTTSRRLNERAAGCDAG